MNVVAMSGLATKWAHYLDLCSSSKLDGSLGYAVRAWRRRGAKARRAQGCQGKATPFAKSQDEDLWEAEEDSPIDEREEHEGAERSVLSCSVIVLDWSHPISKGYISSLEWFHSSPLNQATQMTSCMARVGSTPPSIQTLLKWSWNFSLSNNKKCSPCCHERAGLY
jgi:hypothetical protein